MAKRTAKKKPAKKTTPKQPRIGNLGDKANTNGFAKNPGNINRAGREKGTMNKSTILRKMAEIQIHVNKDSKFHKQLEAFMPGFLGKEKKTLEELWTMRLIVEAIFSKKPAAYIKELMDRMYGKAPQAVDVTTNGETINPDKEDLLKRLEEIRAERDKIKGKGK